MDAVQRIGFCPPGTPYFDLVGTDGQEAFDYPVASRTVPPGWSRSTDTDWVHMLVDDQELPEQGWKIHVSATTGGAEDVLDVVVPYCTERRITFKFVRGEAVLRRRNGKYGERSASGKFVTIYPLDEAQLAEILHELDDLLDGHVGPYILSDLRYRSGPLYVRYGGFRTRYVRMANGEEVPCIEDGDGRLVPDLRGPSFKVPAWVTVPDVLQESLAARGAGTLGDFPFKVTSALHFSNGGGVYRGVDTRDGSEVLLREARPYAAEDDAGDDAVARQAREHWAMTQLADVPQVPSVVDFRAGHEHRFLVRKYAPGEALAKQMLRRNPLYTPADSAAADVERRAEFVRWAMHILDQVEDGMERMHERGVLFRDLHPGNIIVAPDDSIQFIDFETAVEIGGTSPRGIGTLGFMAPFGVTGPDEDRYSLGCLRLSIFAPVSPAIQWGKDKVEQLIELVTSHFPVPADYADRVRRDLAVADDATGSVTGIVQAPAADPRPLWPRLDAASWPGFRDEIVAGLLATAEPHRADRLFPGDAVQFLTPDGGVNLATGAAGVLWALAAVGAEVPDKHVEWLSQAVDRVPRPRRGLYDGTSGVALALDRLGRHEQAGELVGQLLEVDAADLDNTLGSGLAGYGLTYFWVPNV